MNPGDSIRNPTPQLAQPVAAPCQSRPPLLHSESLFQGNRTVEISHNGELYRLQATRLGKLILTK